LSYAQKKENKQNKRKAHHTYIFDYLSFFIFGVEGGRRKKSCSIASFPIAVADIITCFKDEEKKYIARKKQTNEDVEKKTRI